MLRVVCDLEADSLDPTVIWVLVAKEADTGNVHTFIRPDLDPDSFREFSKRVSVWIGHNFLGYDLWILS